MTLDIDLDRLLAYESWANRQALQSIIDAGAAAAAPDHAVAVMSHIIGASRLWLARLNGASSPLAVWPTLPVTAMGDELDALERLWTQWRESATPASLSQTVAYINTRGESWSNITRDILTHLTMHSAYHRGQIASIIGRAGGKPAATDYIMAVREGYV